MKKLGKKSRNGIAMIIVLTMISIAMAISYAMLRSQTQAVQIQQNGDRRGDAQNAAMVGLAAGLRAMHQSSWSGVNTTITGTLSALDSYSVTFTAGDASLTSTDPNYDLLPYRVTITSTGKSVSATNSQINSTYTVTAVAQLVPKKLATEPANWSQVRQYTVYQTDSEQFSMDVPGRIEGPLRLQGAVKLGANYSWSSSARSRYLADLNAMRSARNEVQTITLNNATGGSYRLQFNGSVTGSINHNASASTMQTVLRSTSTIGSGNVNVSGSGGGPYAVTFVSNLANQNVPQLEVYSTSLSGLGAGVTTGITTQGWPGYADCRPVVGPISYPTASTDSTNQALIASLGVTTTNISDGEAMTLSLPQILESYRLFAGGPTYMVPQVGSSLSNTSLAPDTATNPAGIYFSDSTVSLGNNVSVTGTLITGDGLNINGTNVSFSPVNLRPLSDTSTPIRLPASVVRQELFVNTSVSATINGFLVCGDQFCIERGQASAVFTVTGRLITDEFILRRRSNWDFASWIWGLFYSWFTGQQNATNGTPFFPVYLADVGLDPNPLLTIKPDPSSLFEHWQDLSQPIYVPGTGDPGLCWDVLRVVADP